MLPDEDDLDFHENQSRERITQLERENGLLRTAVDQVLAIGFYDDDPRVRLMLRACRRAAGREVAR